MSPSGLVCAVAIPPTLTAAVQAVTAKASFCQRLIVGVLPYRGTSDSPSIVSSARTRQQETPGEIIQARLRSSTGSHPSPVAVPGRPGLDRKAVAAPDSLRAAIAGLR